jgi:Mrp family chromosome partitioning ATPase
MNEDASDGRDLQQLLEPVLRRWKIVLVVALLISGATYLYYRQTSPTYVASTSVFLETSSLGSALTPGTPPADPTRTAENQARLAVTPAAAQLAARRLDYRGDPRALLPLVEVTPDADSDFLTIRATTSESQQAANVANAFAEGFVQLGTGRLRDEAARTRAAIERELAQLPPTRENRTLRLSLRERLQSATLIETLPSQGARQVDRARPPAVAAGASPTRNAIFAGILGLILGALLVQGLEALQRRLPSSRAEETYGVPLLAAIPFNRKAAAEARRVPGLPSAMMEPIRTLRTALDHGFTGESRPRTILVTSAIAGEGKSTVAKCLALGFFRGGRRVLLIDGDLRRPSLHEFFDIEPEPGLSDVLRSGGPLGQNVRRILLEGETEPALESAMVPFADDPADPEPMAAVDWSFAPEARALPQRSRSESRAGNRRRGSAKARSQNGAERVSFMLDLIPAVDLLPSGSRASDPAALLGSEHMSRVLAEAADSYDVVLIDSSPLLTVSDTIPLATAVDGVIVVTRSDYTTRDAAQSFRRAFERLPSVKVLGLVANGVRDSESQYRHQYADGA